MSSLNKTISNQIEILIKARCPLICLETYEEQRALKEINEICAKRDKKLHIWSITTGLRPYTSGTFAYSKMDVEVNANVILKIINKIIDGEENSVYVLLDFHPFLKDFSIVRKLRELATILRSSTKNVILMSPTLEIPPDLEKDVSLAKFALPTEKELEAILDDIVKTLSSNKKVCITATNGCKEKIVQATLGLSETEAETAILKAVVQTNKIDEDTIGLILNEKEQIIQKTGFLQFYRTSENIDNIGGLEVLKDWLRKRSVAFTKKAKEFGLPMPKGLLLIGVQGCGKSLTAKSISSLWKMPLLRLDLGALFSSFIGSSEENTRRALAATERIAPCILWLDEIEKGLSGVQSSGQSDAGTTARVFATILTWMQEKSAPVFVIATANDVSMLPPELLRRGRIDEIFFVDLPSKQEREEIIKIHVAKKKRDIKNFDISKLAEISEWYSGAEIEQSVIAGMYDAFDDSKDLNQEYLENAIKNTVPLSRTMGEKIDDLRNWANGRAKFANKGNS